MSELAKLQNRLAVKQGFAQQFLVMLSGSVASRALLLLALPLLTRYYGPSEIGRWQLFVGLLLVLETIVNWRYEVAIVLPKTRRRASELFWTCMISSIGMSVLWAIPILLMPQLIAESMGDNELAGLLWIVPLVMIGLGIEQSCSYWLTRIEAFGRLSVARVCKSIGTVVVPFSMAVAGNATATQLILGTVIGQALVTGIILYYVMSRASRPSFAAFTWRGIRITAAIYKNYPTFVAPYSLVAQSSRRILYFMLAVYSSSHAVGLFALAMQLTFIPVTFVTAALNQVLYPKIVSQLSTGKLQPIVLKIFWALGISAAPWVAVAAYHSESVLRFTLGPQWEAAGPYAAAACAPAYMLLLTSWLTRIYDVLGKQRLAVLLQVCFDGVSVGTFFAVLWCGGSATTATSTYFALVAIYNVAWLAITFRVAGFSVCSLVSPLVCASLLVGGAFGICSTTATYSSPTTSAIAAVLLTLLFQIVTTWTWRKGNLNARIIEKLETFLGKANASPTCEGFS